MNDCFANKIEKCEILKKLDCEGCNFYKSVERHKADTAAAVVLVRALPQDFQKLLSYTYGEL